MEDDWFRSCRKEKWDNLVPWIDVNLQVLVTSGSKFTAIPLMTYLGDVPDRRIARVGVLKVDNIDSNRKEGNTGQKKRTVSGKINNDKQQNI